MRKCKCESECKCECKSEPLEVVKVPYANGNPECEFTANEQQQIHGTYKRWHQNGQLSEQREYVNGNRHGIHYVWNDVGTLILIQQHVNNTLLVNVQFTQNNQILKKPILTITKPEHPNVGAGLIEVVKVLQERGIKFKIAKIGGEV